MKPSSTRFAAESARWDSGQSLEELAARAHLHPRYLRQLERNGCRSYGRALRLARLYGCAVDAFRVKRIVKGNDPQGLHAQGQLPTPAATGADTFARAGRSTLSSQRYRKPAPPILTLVGETHENNA